ncbi:MAG: carbon-phosphorus lyase complex subunit PhnI [Pseudomonadota bacterium]
MYVAVKGGEKAIDNAHRWLASERRGPRDRPELSVSQIKAQLGLTCDRVMVEGSLYDPELAALAIKQACGDLIEAAFLLRAYRSTLPRFGYSEPIRSANMQVQRRISSTFKDLPGGQILGPTFDYTHRILEFKLLAEDDVPEPEKKPAKGERIVPVSEILARQDLVRRETHPDAAEITDITREPLDFPADRAARLQALARGDEGFVLAIGYSSQRGFGNTHPFVAELRVGLVVLEFVPQELGFAIEIGDLLLTECQTVNQFQGSATEPPQFTRGYGLVFGRSERKAVAVALVDRALQASELDEDVTAPAQDVEFVLSHCDNIQASGFVEHLKLPHHVDFQAELETVRGLRDGSLAK